MKKIKIYLAGKMSGLTFEEMNDWRVEASKKLKNIDESIHTISPVDFYNFEMDKSEYTERECMDFDLKMVKYSDIILVNLDYPDSIGTSVELFYAYLVLNIPVIGYGTAVNHPWIENCVDKKLKTLDDAVDYVFNYYIPNI